MPASRTQWPRRPGRPSARRGPAREHPRRGQRARVVAARDHDVEAPVCRRAGDDGCRRVVPEATDGRRCPFEDPAHEAVPHGDGGEPEVLGDVEAAPTPAVELPAAEHPADAVLSRGQRPEPLSRRCRGRQPRDQVDEIFEGEDGKKDVAS
jgi:hypothetical protein